MVATAGFSMFCAFGGVASGWGDLSYSEQARWESLAAEHYRTRNPYPNRSSNA